MSALESSSSVLEIPDNANAQSKSDWLFNTQSGLLQADWLIIENNENATYT